MIHFIFKRFLRKIIFIVHFLLAGQMTKNKSLFLICFRKIPF